VRSRQIERVSDRTIAVAADNQGGDTTHAEGCPRSQIHPFVELHVRASAEFPKAETQFLELANQQSSPRSQKLARCLLDILAAGHTTTW
jgi:hypothetical protein